MSRTILAAVCSIAALAPATPAMAALAIPAPAIPAPPAATMIVLERSGGFAGRHDSFVVDRTTYGGRRSLRMVASPAFRQLRGSYQPANACCDRFAYRIDVTYRGGRHQRVAAVQGTDAPRILWDVIAEVETAGSRL
ncbi:protealysin inhibitor emfourin [Actinoplanes sp. NPDC026619]|uniref:protealysin inhibitor emfourin n=1 Tax=Actinoplanes sp. NPDC026619 TaxID=3155798 RepID=UPI0033F2E6FF